MKILDLFCGVGGAALGYIQAGHEVTGVDKAPQPRYPGRFIWADALDYVTDHWMEYDLIHASPPCQAHCTMIVGTRHGVTKHKDLLPQTRGALWQLPLPTIIENVPGSPLRRDVVLCGQMFGLPIARHRYFQITNATVAQPAHPSHEGELIAVYGRGGGRGTADTWREALGIPHAKTRKELANAIPPSYTRYIVENLVIAPRPATAPNDI